MNRRAPIAILLIASLFLTGFVRDFVSRQREKLVPPAPSAARLNNLNSFSLALLLGGLRGPLVMYLWPSVENQKNQKDLEDIDTKIEMIRLLQPEFDSVHIFQMWNKAYNLSVQMSSVYNKYLAILDALDYGHRIDAQRPDNINIQVAIAGIYFDKLGDSQEKRLYGKWLRRDTLPHQGQERSGNDPNFRRTRHDQMLDATGHILPEFKNELRYLEPYDNDGGFPYGLSPHAIGYNYYKRAQILHGPPFNQEHLQLSGHVIDTRPAVSMKIWAEDLWEIGQRGELQAYGYDTAPSAMQAALAQSGFIGNLHDPANERLALELLDASLPIDRPVVDASAIKEALFSYDRAAKLAADAIAEYDRRLSVGLSFNIDNYATHKTSLRAMTDMVQANARYLQAMAAAPDQQAQHLKSARDLYQRSAIDWYILIFKYWVEDDVVLRTYPRDAEGKQYSKATIQNADPRLFPALYQSVAQATAGRTYKSGQAAEDLHVNEREEYKLYINRAAARMQQIDKTLAPSAAKVP